LETRIVEHEEGEGFALGIAPHFSIKMSRQKGGGPSEEPKKYSDEARKSIRNAGRFLSLNGGKKKF